MDDDGCVSSHKFCLNTHDRLLVPCRWTRTRPKKDRRTTRARFVCLDKPWAGKWWWCCQKMFRKKTRFGPCDEPRNRWVWRAADGCVKSGSAFFRTRAREFASKVTAVAAILDRAASSSLQQCQEGFNYEETPSLERWLTYPYPRQRSPLVNKTVNNVALRVVNKHIAAGQWVSNKQTTQNLAAALFSFAITLCTVPPWGGRKQRERESAAFFDWDDFLLVNKTCEKVTCCRYAPLQKKMLWVSHLQVMAAPFSGWQIMAIRQKWLILAYFFKKSTEHGCLGWIEKSTLEFNVITRQKQQKIWQFLQFLQFL